MEENTVPPMRMRIQQSIILVVIVALALIVRLNFAESPGFVFDLRSFAGWMRVIQTNGILPFYEPQYRIDAEDRTYPPLSTVSFGVLANVYGEVGNARMEAMRPAFVSLLKVFPITAEILLIVAVYVWLHPRPMIQRGVSLALALYPALIAISGWWGQVDAMYTLFLVLALISLNKDRPLWAWASFAGALLLKQPALFFAPLILVITFRRYGWRKTVQGIALCGVLCVIAFAPFMLTSGVQNALSPYLQAGGTFPYFTNNAYNTWYIFGSIIKEGEQVVFRDPELLDAQIGFAGLSYQAIGLMMFAAYTLFLMAIMWKQAKQRREFVWAAALFFGFFMLPTEVHERYLYPTAIFILIAAAQDRRLWWAALGIGFTFTYNIMAVLNEGMMRDLLLAPARVGVTFAVVNLALFLVLSGILVAPTTPPNPTLRTTA